MLRCRRGSRKGKIWHALIVSAAPNGWECFRPINEFSLFFGAQGAQGCSALSWRLFFAKSERKSKVMQRRRLSISLKIRCKNLKSAHITAHESSFVNGSIKRANESRTHDDNALCSRPPRHAMNEYCAALSLGRWEWHFNFTESQMKMTNICCGSILTKAWLPSREREETWSDSSCAVCDCLFVCSST